MAWSVTWGAGCLLLLMLWMRSFYYRDLLGGVAWSHVITLESVDGHLGIDWYFLNPAYSGPSWGITRYNHRSHGFGVRMPLQIVVAHWSMLLLLGAICAIPWLGTIGWTSHLNRFSLRDLFIVTTLAAAVLGAIVYALR
jgi:hypothetical protein